MPRRKSNKNTKKSKKGKVSGKSNNRSKSISKRGKQRISKTAGRNQEVTYEVLNEKRNINQKTACIIYTVDQSNGKTYFVVSRKVPIGARLRRSGPNTGAAGTDDKYHGKWTSFGGGKDRKSTELQGAIYEINEESGLSVYNKVGFRNGIKPKLLSLGKKSKNEKLELKTAFDLKGTTLFIFNFDENNNDMFFTLFPKFSAGGRQTAVIVSSSSGECDVVASMTMDDIKREQDKMVSKKNNFFTSYFLNSFQNIVIPEIGKLYEAFGKKHNRTTFTILPDIKGRKIDDLTENKITKRYKELSKKDKNGKVMYSYE